VLTYFNGPHRTVATSIPTYSGSEQASKMLHTSFSMQGKTSKRKPARKPFERMSNIYAMLSMYDTLLWQWLQMYLTDLQPANDHSARSHHYLQLLIVRGQGPHSTLWACTYGLLNTILGPSKRHPWKSFPTIRTKFSSDKSGWFSISELYVELATTWTHIIAHYIGKYPAENIHKNWLQFASK